MKRVVFLLEERSMKVLLEGVLPRLVPDLLFLCVTHSGKQDLEKSIPRKQAPKLAKALEKEKRYADCDAVPKPSVELAALIPGFQKISGARLMGGLLSEQNRSHSFQVFIAGVRQLARRLASTSVLRQTEMFEKE